MTADWLEAIRSVGSTVLVFLVLFIIVTFSPPHDPEAFT